MSEKKKPVLTPGQIIRKRRANYVIGQGYLSLLLRCAALVLVVYVMLTHVFLLTQASGNEMFPAVKDGDVIFAYRLPEKYSKDDVVVYTQNGRTRVGRIVGREKDIIKMDEEGKLVVNGTPQGGEIMYPTYPKDGYEYPYEVPRGHIYILGDYRTQSEDSRDFGPVPVDALQGKVITILRRRGI